MKHLLTAALLLTSTQAFAVQTSFLCRTETKEYIDVVSKGDNTGEVLVQINGGKFLEGFGEFEEPVLFLKIPLDNGVILIGYNVLTDKAIVATDIGGKKTSQNMTCQFRD